MKLATRNSIHAWLMVLRLARCWPRSAHPDRHHESGTASSRRRGRAGLRASLGSTTTASCWRPIFWKSLTNNAIYALTSVPLSVGWRSRWRSLRQFEDPRKAFLRMAYFTPTVLPMIAVANIWLFFYHPQFGLLAAMLKPSASPVSTGLARRTRRSGPLSPSQSGRRPASS